jgi:hypothetical protein
MSKALANLYVNLHRFCFFHFGKATQSSLVLPVNWLIAPVPGAADPVAESYRSKEKRGYCGHIFENTQFIEIHAFQAARFRRSVTCEPQPLSLVVGMEG